MSKRILQSIVFMFSFFMYQNVESKIIINQTANRPTSVNNAETIHFRPIFKQMGSSCGSAAGIGNTFTYELNAIRNTSASIAANQYPYTFTYHFLNDGDDSAGTPEMVKDAWTIAIENGIPSVSDFGGITTGFPTKWMSGYQKYYNGMKNRVVTYDSIALNSSLSIDTMKQWLFDHGNGSSKGGVGVITAFAHAQQTSTITSGAGTGKTILTLFGTGGRVGHAYTVVGYNDNVRFDFNNDGKFSNDGALTNWEIGAVVIANTWGVSSFDEGFAFIPYRLLALPTSEGGLLGNNHFYMCTVKENNQVQLAIKTTLSHSSRNLIALSVGISKNPESTQPEKIRTFQKQFSYSGGGYPMCGDGESDTIEIGLDVSDLVDSVNSPDEYRIFLIVDSKGGAGMIHSMSLMDYTGGVLMEIPSEKNDVPISAGIARISAVKQKSATKRVFSDHSRNGTIHCKVNDSSIKLYSSLKENCSVTISDLQGRICVSSLMLETNKHVTVPVKLEIGPYVLSIKGPDYNHLLNKIIIVP